MITTTKGGDVLTSPTMNAWAEGLKNGILPCKMCGVKMVVVATLVVMNHPGRVGR